jgi:hypothetical protein
MADTDSVIIGRQELKLKIDSGHDINATNQAILEVCQERLPEVVENLSKKLTGKVIIPKIELNLGRLNPDDLESEFLIAFEREFDKTLNEIIQSATDMLSDQDQETFIYSSGIREIIFFARNGTFPWYVSNEISREEIAKDLYAWLDELVSGVKLISLQERIDYKELKRIFSAPRENEFKRLARFLGPTLSRKISVTIQKIDHARDSVSSEKLMGGRSADEIGTDRSMGEFSSIPGERTRDIMAGIDFGNKKRNDVKEFDDLEKNTEDDPAQYFENALFTGSAGIVILNPFLKSFFQKLKLMESERMVRPEKAALVLYHLCHNHKPGHEGELVFEKILAGLEVHQFVDIEQPLPKGFSKEKDELLVSVIGHWTVLKNTSPASFQQGFLQRDGKIVLSGESCGLNVESKGHDVLLGRLSWSFSLFQLSWMKYTVNVDWA